MIPVRLPQLPVRFLAVLVVLLLSSLAAACTHGVCLVAGPRLVSVDSRQGALLNALFGGLLNSSVNVSLLDWQALAVSDMRLDAYLNALQLRTATSSPDEALRGQITLLGALNAATDVAQADGDTALVQALNALSVPVSGLTTPVQVGDLLHVNFPVGALTDVRLNALNLVTGLTQLYNRRNVVATEQPVTLSGAALGLSSVLDSAQLAVQVVEPPIYTCGPAGTAFHTAALRLKVAADLVDQRLDTTALVAALQQTLGANVRASLSLTRLDAYVEVARADGSVVALDALAHAVTLEAAPGVVDVYLGQLDDALFRNRARPIEPATDLHLAPVASLDLTVTPAGALGGAPLADLHGLAVLARGSARGQSGAAQQVTLTAPFPRTVTVSSSSVSVASLVGSLVGTAEVQLGGSLGSLLDPLVGVILPPVKRAVVSALVPALSGVLGGVVDPLLDLMGIGIGEAVVQVLGLGEACASLTLRKEVRNVTQGGPFGTDNTARPGDILEYCLTYANPGLLAATNVGLSDLVGPAVQPLVNVPEYGGQAMRLGGAGLSAAADGDAGEWQHNALTARVPVVPPGGSGQLCFRVQVV